MDFNYDIIIYQMGRVGSHSVLQTINSVEHNYKMHHVHALDLSIGNRRTKLPLKDQPLSEPTNKSWFLLDRVRQEKRKWRIISLVRDPVARNWSAFHCFREGKGDFVEDYNHHAIIDWFEINVEPFFGIDVYSEPFDTNKGWKVYENDRASMLLLRTENISEILPEALLEFAGLAVNDVCCANRGSWYKTRLKTKAYHSIKMPEAYVDEMYSTRLARHFYTIDELNKFKHKWTLDGP